MQENMKSSISKRSIALGGHKTSVSLEDAFWKALKEIASSRRMTVADLVAGIDADRQHGNLSSAIRLFVLGSYREQLLAHEARQAPRQTLDAAVPPALSSQGQ